MIVVEGDLFKVTEGAIGHGVNCRGAMGAGVAKIVRKKYPEMYSAYRNECKSGRLMPGGVFPWFDEASGLWIYNMASQNRPGPAARLNWLADTASATLDHAAAHGVSQVSIPQIGCGIGGLKWVDVAKTLQEVERNRTSYFRVILLPSQ